MTDAFHPAYNGRCPRCSAGGQETSVFCLECGLRLRPGMAGLAAPAQLISDSWMRANPVRADHWITRGEPRNVHDLVLSLAHAQTAPESEAEIEELECWVLRGRLFDSQGAPTLGPLLATD
jgi:hypothetical protein